MAQFESGKHYSSTNGKYVINIVKRTEKSIWVNQHHMNPAESFPFLKRIRVDNRGDEFVRIDNIFYRADREVSREDFRRYINENIGK